MKKTVPDAWAGMKNVAAFYEWRKDIKEVIFYFPSRPKLVHDFTMHRRASPSLYTSFCVWRDISPRQFLCVVSEIHIRSIVGAWKYSWCGR